MKQLAFALGLLTLSATAATQAHADFAVVRFHSGYCRVWGPPAAPPQDFQYLAFRRGWPPHIWWQHMFVARGAAEGALHEAIATHRCHNM
ncbi:MAG TPA: hypothetical protein VGG11_00165 [Xanthobacteraceae bacterium]|jgi:hypothetical protein